MGDTEEIRKTVGELRGVAQRLEVAVARQEEINRSRPCGEHLQRIERLEQWREGDLKDAEDRRTLDRESLNAERRWRWGILIGGIVSGFLAIASFFKH